MPLIFILKLIFVGLVITCAINDFRSLTIPNKIILIMLALFPLAALIAPDHFPVINHLMAAGLIFIISYILFVLKLMGGGDTKMMTVVGLWLGLNNLSSFVVIMAITGGLLACISLILKKNKKLLPKNSKPNSWFDQLKNDKSVVPYGIAIALGAILTIF